jgi:hypothetical protein
MRIEIWDCDIPHLKLDLALILAIDPDNQSATAVWDGIKNIEEQRADPNFKATVAKALETYIKPNNGICLDADVCLNEDETGGVWVSAWLHIPYANKPKVPANAT